MIHDIKLKGTSSGIVIWARIIEGIRVKKNK
jgi:hypothetical protein